MCNVMWTPVTGAKVGKFDFRRCGRGYDSELVQLKAPLDGINTLR